MRAPVSALLLLVLSAVPARAEDVAALIQRQSQEFSDASASGDAKIFERYLDDNVVFMNESGEVATKHDLVAGAGEPRPKGMAQKLVQTDFKVQLHGTVAVTSFTDESTVEMAGQTLHAKYRSIEVWMQKSGGWKMVSSQTLAVNDDPPAVALPAKALDEYVGTYKASDDFVLKIARTKDGLTGSLNGGAPYALAVETTDVLFTPGQPRLRRIIERDAHHKITGLRSRREGHDLVFRRVG